jgi:DNA-3-methyladenine glycosylase
VLLRAGEPLIGIEEMRRRRDGRDLIDLCRGPARLCQALGVDRALDGTDLVGGDAVWIGAGSPAVGPIVTTPRIGIRRDAERPWRFVDAGSRFVSGRHPAGARGTASATRSSRP